MSRSAETGDNDKIRRIHEKLDGGEKARPRGGSGAIDRLARNLVTLVQMIRDKDFKIPAVVRTKMLLCLIYIVSPIDLIPDFIFPVVGFIDDAFVFGYLLKVVADLLDRYRAFRRGEVVDFDGDEDDDG